MDDVAIRLACLDAAVRTVGNPNCVQQAKAYYDFVTEDTTATTNTAPKGQKGTRK